MIKKGSLAVAALLALNAEHLYLLSNKKARPEPTEEEIKKSVIENNKKILKAQEKRNRRATKIIRINK